MTENELLSKIYELVLSSEACPHLLPAQWMSTLLYMHRRRWLYCSVKGSQLNAVLGAYRIKAWDEKGKDKMPEKEEGDILYIPFVASEGKIPIAVRRLVKYCLRENPGIKKIVYYRKSMDPARDRFRIRNVSRPLAFGGSMGIPLGPDAAVA
ncbi:MAG TPA: hypothetical protein VL688_09950 [Verrucomicrobiae bacterium]|jgi:hypothetical protein|nr:hypothetical protein [Verrucomicrobiae bacterium]